MLTDPNAEPNNNIGTSNSIFLKVEDTNNEVLVLLRQVLANQAVIFHRIDELYHGQSKKVARSFYDEQKAFLELEKISKKLL